MFHPYNRFSPYSRCITAKYGGRLKFLDTLVRWILNIFIYGKLEKKYMFLLLESIILGRGFPYRYSMLGRLLTDLIACLGLKILFPFNTSWSVLSINPFWLYKVPLERPSNFPQSYVESTHRREFFERFGNLEEDANKDPTDLEPSSGISPDVITVLVCDLLSANSCSDKFGVIFWWPQLLSPAVVHMMDYFNLLMK